MTAYFIRRFLLLLPTLIGATLVVFGLTRIVPGGPMEKAMQQALAMGDRGGGGRDAGGSMSDEQKEQLALLYGFDQPYLRAYVDWLGVWPREEQKQYVKFEDGKNEMPVTLKVLLPRDQWKPNNAYKVTQATVTRDGKLSTGDEDGWKARWEPEKKRVAVFRPQFNGVLQGNFGNSLSYNLDVVQMMLSKMPVSLFYGLATFLLTYLVCIPLGIVKAIKHRTALDNATSVLIFIGYAIPGFLLGSMLVVYLAARMDWFPTDGFVSENFASMGFGGKVWDIMHHAVLPLTCYMISNFALMTMMMKNNLMDNLAADYVRTAIAKGASYRRAVLGHALRNSLIPIATTLGNVTLVFVTGSMLIERIFQIDGFGLLMIQSINDRDFPLVMGIITLDVILIVLGNILSDFFVAVTDPRVRFE